MRTYERIGLLGLAAAALVLPASAPAQVLNMGGTPDDVMSNAAVPFEVEMRGGVALPVEDLTEYADPGYHFGGGVAYYLNDHVGLRVDGDVSAFPGETPEADEFKDVPDMRLWSVGAGVEFDVAGRDQDDRWSLQTNLGVGATTLSTDEFLIPDPDNQATPSVFNISETYPNLNAGVEIGFDATDNIELAVGSRAFYTFADKEDLQALTDRRAVGTPLENAVSMPVTATVRVALPNR